MNKMISYDKLPKKQKKAYDEKRRVVWQFSPVTRKKESGKAYDRKKARKWEEDIPFAALFVCPLLDVLPHGGGMENTAKFKPPV
ncbi:MAG: hypothetical protein IJM72_02915 [Deltaproteobacteria bacterium]|nr:hypothetical protein [Deltaproteobacteria bacterium]